MESLSLEREPDEGGEGDDLDGLAASQLLVTLSGERSVLEVGMKGRLAMEGSLLVAKHVMVLCLQ